MLLRSRALLYSAFLFLGACGGLSGPDGGGASFAPSVEPTYCATTQTHSPSITVTSTGQFRSRIHSAGGLLGPSVARGIPYAEVQVLNSAGTTVQCGETSLTGVISVTIPKVAGTYTLKVLSRADNTHYKTSVLNNASANIPYSISVAFTVTGAEAAPVAVTLPVASHTGTLEGGAFNILEQIYIANKFLKDNSAGCAVCDAFSVAPKSRIYWTKGASPGAYYGSPSTAISFFSKDDDYSIGILRGIYMLGGINGDVDCTDTDHFDNSVILHEYGHFLEDVYAGSDSPGGSHDGNRLVDPRLAWSEGWANFIQGAMISRSVYQDTVGNNSCSGGSTFLGVNLNLESSSPGQDYMDVSTPAGQGIFREVSVSRALYDMYSATAGGDGIGANLGFPLMWDVFSSPSPNGLNGSGVAFRNIGLFNSILRPLVQTHENGKLANFDIVIGNTNEHQVPTTSPVSSLRREYGLPVIAEATPATNCEFDINGVVATEGGVTNFLENEDFLQYYYDGTAGKANITLRYGASIGTVEDLDLYVYRRSHVYGNSSTIAAKSARIAPEVSGQYVETISLSGQPAGIYLINVSSDRDAATVMTSVNTKYHLELSGSEWLCP